MDALHVLCCWSRGAVPFGVLCWSLSTYCGPFLPILLLLSMLLAFHGSDGLPPTGIVASSLNGFAWGSVCSFAFLSSWASWDQANRFGLFLTLCNAEENERRLFIHVQWNLYVSYVRIGPRRLVLVDTILLTVDCVYSSRSVTRNMH